MIEQVRRVRAEKNIAPKNPVNLFVQRAKKEDDFEMDCVIEKLCNIPQVEYVNEKVPGSVLFIEQNVEYFVPFADNIDKDAELKKLNDELAYAEKFLQSVLKKLANERFVQNAPEQVVAIERKKQADAEAKIKLLKEQIAGLA